MPHYTTHAQKTPSDHQTTHKILPYPTQPVQISTPHLPISNPSQTLSRASSIPLTRSLKTGDGASGFKNFPFGCDNASFERLLEWKSGDYIGKLVKI